jgi:hypothetical protein
MILSERCDLVDGGQGRLDYGCSKEDDGHFIVSSAIHEAYLLDAR